jgi:hypothetical protein
MKFYLPQLHNGEHVAYHEESLEQLNQSDPATFGISEQAGTYSAALNEEKSELDVFSASELSPASAKLDKRRNRAYSTLLALVAAGICHW